MQNSTQTTEVHTDHATLGKGDTGEEVKYLQNQINIYFGSVLIVDGIFGSKTEGYVKQFQEDNHLTVDGIVGPQTWNSLDLLDV